MVYAARDEGRAMPTAHGAMVAASSEGRSQEDKGPIDAPEARVDTGEAVRGAIGQSANNGGRAGSQCAETRA